MQRLLLSCLSVLALLGVLIGRAATEAGAQQVVLAAMQSPAPGSSLTSSTVPFSWTSGTGVTQYWLWVSTVEGDGNLFSESQGTNLSRTVGGVPTMVRVYVRLWSLVAGEWLFIDYQYGPGAVTSTPTPALFPTPTVTALPTVSGTTPAPTTTPAGLLLAEMLAPTPGSTLASSTVPFSWSSGAGVTQYWLWVSTVEGDGNLFSESQGTDLSRTVSGVPTTVRTYVRLWSLVAGEWLFIDYQYGPGAVTLTPTLTPVLTPTSTMPPTATVVPSPTVTGTLTATPTATISTPTLTPSATSTPALMLAAMLAPSPGSTLASSTVTFSWTSGTGVAEYWLWVSTVHGDGNLFSESQGTNLSRTVSGVPTTQRVYVRLWSRVPPGPAICIQRDIFGNCIAYSNVGGSGQVCIQFDIFGNCIAYSIVPDWQFIDYQYGPGAVTSTPAPTLTPTSTPSTSGSGYQVVITATGTATLTWTPILGATGYTIWASSGGCGFMTQITAALPSTTTTLTLSLTGTYCLEVRDLSGTRAFITSATGTGGVGGSISINDAACNAGAVCNFTVTQTGGATAATVTYQTTNGTAFGDAMCTAHPHAAIDFVVANGAVTVGPNSTVSIPITTCLDQVGEGSEVFFVNLTSASSGIIADSQGVGTIGGTAGGGSISINDTVCSAGTVCNFTVTQTGGTSTATVTYQTTNVTAFGTGSCPTTPSATQDFVVASGTVTVGPNSTVNIPIAACVDQAGESSEAFFVNLTSTTAGTIVDGAGLGTITTGGGLTPTPTPTPTSAAGAISINDASCVSGSTCTFTVTQAGGTVAAAVSYSTVNGTATGGAACGGAVDYATVTSGTVTVGANGTAGVAVTTCTNAPGEPSEFFSIILVGTNTAWTITDGVGIGTIAETPGGGSISINDAVCLAGTSCVFTVTRTGGIGPVTVNYATSNISAFGLASCALTPNALEDFIAIPNGSVAVGPNSSVQVAIVTCPNHASELATEFFNVNLTAPMGVTITRSQGLGRIDFAPPTTAGPV